MAKRLEDGHPSALVSPPKGREAEYSAGNGNLLVINSSYPTRSTDVSDRVTFALFEHLEK